MSTYTGKKATPKNQVPAEWIHTENHRWAYFMRQSQKEIASKK